MHFNRFLRVNYSRDINNVPGTVLATILFVQCGRVRVIILIFFKMADVTLIQKVSVAASRLICLKLTVINLLSNARTKMN
jgi:hypothetical protein